MDIPSPLGKVRARKLESTANDSRLSERNTASNQDVSVVRANASLANCLIALRNLNLSLALIGAPLFEPTSRTTVANLGFRNSFGSFLHLTAMLFR